MNPDPKHSSRFVPICGSRRTDDVSRYGTHQCCGSGMFIPDPDFYPSRIPDPKTATKERGEKIFLSNIIFTLNNFIF
jgi:hypothetical protein